jgi:hypothetical protein
MFSQWRPRSKRSRWRGAVLFYISAALVLWWGICGKIDYKKISSWLPATARVESSRVIVADVNWRSGSVGYSQRVNYSFLIAHTRFLGVGPATSLYITAEPLWPSALEASRTLPLRYATIKVIYNPENPDESVMLPSPNDDHSGIVIICGLVLAGAGAFRMVMLLRTAK